MRRISTASFGVAQGSLVLFDDHAAGGPMWTGQGPREVRHIIQFETAFSASPLVHLGMSMWDLDSSVNARGDLQAEAVTVTGFELVFRTWSDSRLARIRADWLAIGPMRDEDEWNVD